MLEDAYMGKPLALLAHTISQVLTISHSYMREVVAERDEQEYCTYRSIASTEASMQLSLMVHSLLDY